MNRGNLESLHETGAIVADRYRLETLLGEGGHATVWGATQVITQKRVALKLFKEKGVRNLVEARAAAHLDHPNVIAVHDVFLDERGAWVMAMDWLEGESLAVTLARETTLSLERVIALFLPVLEALAEAHRARIVHRDLKPSNFFLTRAEAGEDERLVLLDFGVAKVLDETLGETAHTASGTLLGTPHYMAPEQVFGESSADTRADLWSLGVVLCECLTGKRPTEALNVGGVLKRITMRDVTRLRTLDPTLPASLLDHVDALLSFEPEKRPATVAETIQVLRGLQDGTAAPAPRASNARLAAAVAILAAMGAAGVVLARGPAVRAEPRAVSPPALPAPPATGTASAPAFAPRVELAATASAAAASVAAVRVTAAKSATDAAAIVPPSPAPARSSASRRPGVIETNPYD